MGVEGTCEKCGGTTADYRCLNCTEAELEQTKLENRDLRGALDGMVRAFDPNQCSKDPAVVKAREVLTGQRKPEVGVFCLEHRKVMTNGICPKCGQQ